MSYYRRSGNDYGYDDYYRGTERWDRDRFERMSGRSRPSRGGESFRYEEDDRYYDRRSSNGRGSRVEVVERDYDDRYYDDERYSAPRRQRPAYLDEDRYQISNREIAPYRPRYERESDRYESYDRRPDPRYEQERDINVNVNMRSPPPPQPPQPYERRQSPRREYFEEDEYEDVRIRREKERSTYRRYDDHDDNREEPPSPAFKRGRTRMPKRLVHRSSLIQKGYPFEEETDFYIVRMALRKDQIDEVIKISESYFHEEKLSVTISETKALPAPEPAEEPTPEPETEDKEIVETVTTKVIENPTEEDLEKYSKTTLTKENSSSSNDEEEQQSNHHHHHDSKEKSRSTSTHVSKQSTKVQKDTLSPSTSHHSHHRGRSRSQARNIEIVAEKSRSSSEEEEDRSKDDVEVIRVEKDRSGRGQFVAQRSPNRSPNRSRSRRRRPSQKMVNAALYSLT